MKPPVFITALGTPLTFDESEQLHEEGLRAHLDDQFTGGIRSVLIAGTMGMMQLQTDETYRKLVAQTVQHFGKRGGEVLVGAGDASFARTRDRIKLLNEHKIDGVVVLAPYFIQFRQDELIDYYTALADVAKAPLYLYDLPQRTHSKLEWATVLEIAKHKNIGGIKCSDDFGYTRQLIDQLPAGFRVVIAQPDLMDVLLRSGYSEHLDGMFCPAPHWVSAIGRCAMENDWDKAAQFQRKLSMLKRVFIKYGVFPAFNAVMNARGFPGRYAPRPYRQLTDAQKAALVQESIVKELLAGK